MYIYMFFFKFFHIIVYYKILHIRILTIVIMLHIRSQDLYLQQHLPSPPPPCPQLLLLYSLLLCI